MALRISKVVREIKEFKLLKKMLKKGYINFYAGSENENESDYISFSSSSEKDRRMCKIAIVHDNRFSVIRLLENENIISEFSSMDGAFRFVESFIWDVLPKQMLEDILEIGSYNV